ncbi:DUF1217 domain-containing protein [Frigidibacter sp. MR17.14]|uniref:DUF1217 domain-containing protein n=1 Tax=Frigidibacter sp. MR17.14 TaxID=3126509 RepID=UPI003012CA5B
MSYQPIVPIGGFAGWAMLNRTMTSQKQAFAASGEPARNVAAFKERIASVTSAEALVKDRQLLSVALGAFGLQDDINNKFFITKALSDGTTDASDLANRVSNKAYLSMAQAFGFGDGTVHTADAGFADQIAQAYLDRQFEVAVGDSNESFRFALNAQRELPALADKTSSDTTKWYTVLGSPPLRKVFESAFGLPAAFGAIDVDLQVETLRDRADSYLGSRDFAQFGDSAAMDKLIRLYLVRSDASAGQVGLSGAAIASQILAGG